MAIDSARLSMYHQALFRRIPAPVVVLDADRRILDGNPAAADLIGLSREQLRECRVDDILVGSADSLAAEFAETCRRGSWRGEQELRRLDGATVPIEGRLEAIQLLTGPVYVWIWHDLTEQRSLQAMRNTFIASASHELRTPLTAALAALGLMQQPGLGDLPPAHRELTDNAMRNIQRLRILVDDLLAEGQLQVGALTLSRTSVDLRGVITGAVETIYSLLQRKGQTVEIDLPESLPISGDARRLEQVFVNLLINANQHTPKGTRIGITGRTADGEVTVAVADDGPGIPAGQVKTVFERFSRADPGSGGTGLGLAIARDLIGLHGGRIWAESASGQGVTFRISLPRQLNGGNQ